MCITNTYLSYILKNTTKIHVSQKCISSCRGPVDEMFQAILIETKVSLSNDKNGYHNKFSKLIKAINYMIILCTFNAHLINICSSPCFLLISIVFIRLFSVSKETFLWLILTTIWFDGDDKLFTIILFIIIHWVIINHWVFYCIPKRVKSGF